MNTNRCLSRSVCACWLAAATVLSAAAPAAFAQTPAPRPRAVAPAPPAAPDSPAPPAPPAPQAPAPPAPPVPESAATRRGDLGGRPVNVQVDVVVSDQAAAGAAGRKAVSLLAADRSYARLRVARQVPNAPRLNVDVRPVILTDGTIRLELTLEYQPNVEGSTETASLLNESVIAILKPGTPLVLSRAADPASDRRMTIEVTAAIVK